MKNRGFPLIEFMIVMTIIGILLAIGIPAFDGETRGHSYGINGLAETRCIEGMKFVVGQSGSVQQILGPNGGGVACQ